MSTAAASTSPESNWLSRLGVEPPALARFPQDACPELLVALKVGHGAKTFHTSFLLEGQGLVLSHVLPSLQRARV